MDTQRWLSDTTSRSQDGRYRHRLLIEKDGGRDSIMPEMVEYIQNAHEDVKRHLRNVARFNLDPLLEPLANDPAEGYPQCFHVQTLKSYFGEIFPAIIAENMSPFDEDGWKVPAHLFRFHLVALQQVENIRQTGIQANLIPGRTGDDCVAFQRDNNGRIIRSLFCEAKCTQNHSRELIKDAHKKISDSRYWPVDTMLIIEILKDYDDDESEGWINSLHQLRLRDYSEEDYERCDLISYICGQFPKRNNSWISTSNPTPEYTGGRRLECVELHLNDVLGFVQQVYEIKGD